MNLVAKIDLLAAQLAEVPTAAAIKAFSELTVLAFSRGVISYAQFDAYGAAIDAAKAAA